MGHFCTSSMEVLNNGGKISVTWFPQHKDHEVNYSSLVHMNLPKGVKDNIAGTVINYQNFARINLQGLLKLTLSLLFIIIFFV